MLPTFATSPSTPSSPTRSNVSSDPFLYMEQHNKTYGFVIAIKELVETVPNLFRYASAYKRQHNFKSKGLWEMFLKDQPSPNDIKPVESPQSVPDGDAPKSDPAEKDELPEIDPESMEGENYNMCHFWSNFEIARLDFFRSKEYEAFFNMMDRSGGFWAERVPQLPHPLPPPYFRLANVFCCSGETHLSIR